MRAIFFKVITQSFSCFVDYSFSLTPNTKYFNKITLIEVKDSYDGLHVLTTR